MQKVKKILSIILVLIMISVYAPSDIFTAFGLSAASYAAVCSHKNAVNYEETAPNCVSDGYSAGKYCPDCKTWLEGHNIISATGHIFGDKGVIIKAATCSENGIEAKICMLCNSTVSELILCDPETYPESPHNYDNNKTYEYSFSYPAAEELVLKFSSDTVTEDFSDYIYIYGRNGVKIGQYCGTQLRSKKITVSGDSFSIRLVTDASFSDYGFRFETIHAKAYSESNSRIIPALNPDKGCTDLNNDDICDTCSAVFSLLTSGSCGESVTWKLYEGGLLKISGSGDIASDESYSPWNDYKDDIKRVVIEDGITGIGEYAFSYCSYLENVSVASSVTNIGAWAFSCCTSLKNITVPPSVKNIGDYAFSYCTDLESINISDGVVNIGAWALCYCSDLKSISIPKSVMSIGSAAFYSCTSLEGVLADINNTKYMSVDGVLYNKNGTTLIYYPDAKSLTSFNVPDKVTSIGEYSFSSCTALESVNIPLGVTRIGTYAFSDCTALKNIAIPESVTSIDSSAFYCCKALTEITVPESVTRIGASAFYNCSALNRIIIFNPDCEIYDTEDTIYHGATIISFADSAAKVYADKYGRKFEIFDCSHNGAENYDAVEPDCVNDGYTAGVYCSLCDTWIHGHEKISAAGHIFGDEMVMVKKASCSDKGYESKICTVCGSAAAELVLCDSSMYPQTPHDYENDKTYEYTFSYPGAAEIIIKFSEDTRTESLSDIIYIFDSKGEKIGQFSGIELCLKEIDIEGESFTIRLTCDDKNTEYGFSFESIYAKVYDKNNSNEIAALNPENGCEDSNGDDICDNCGFVFSVTASGSGGNNVSWKLYEKGLLKISGTGEMDFGYSDAPWYDYKALIEDIVIEEGVTAICPWAFEYCTSVENIVIPASVVKIGNSAFYRCMSLKSVTILNAGCEIYDNSETIYQGAVIIAANGSSAHAYAQKYGRTFEGMLHNFESTVTEPDCVNKGYTTYFCRDCDYSYVDSYVDALGHSFGADWIIIKEADCTENGIRKNSCERCLETVTEEIIASGHTDEDNNGICNICGNNMSDISVGEEKLIEVIANEITYLKFIPEKSGEYTFFSSADSDTCGYLFDVNKNTLMYNDDNGESGNFSITYTLEAGKVYYWAAKYFSDSASGSFNVTLMCQHTDKEADGICDVCEKSSVLARGTYGDNMTWVIYGNTLVISGAGEVNYEEYYSPWYSYRSYIKTAVAENGVTHLGDYVFAFCTALEAVNLPDSVVSIGENAFSYCSTLKAFTIPAGIKKLNKATFFNCTALESIVIPDNITGIEEDAFKNCTSLRKITFMNSSCVIYDNENVIYPDAVIAAAVGSAAHNYALKYMRAFEELNIHNYEKTITLSTCTSGGYTTYTCTVCGYSYKADETPARGHSLEAFVEHPTCTQSGTVSEICKVCSYTHSVEEIPASGHLMSSNGACAYCGRIDGNECEHICHYNGLAGFIFRVMSYFMKIFGINHICECGQAHY